MKMQRILKKKRSMTGITSMNTKKYAAAVLTICMLLLSITRPALAAEGTSTGTATAGNVSPSISNPELWDSAESSDKNNTALTVNTEYHINFTVTDTNSLEDLNNVTVIIWDSGSTTESGSDAERDHYTFTWTESSDIWASSPSGFVITGNCKDPGTSSSETSYEFTLAFDLSKVATYASSSTAWKIKIIAYDDSDASDSDATLMFGSAFYSEISIGDATHSWSGNPGSENNTLPGDGDVDFTVITNDDYDVQAKGSGDLSSGTHTIALSNVRIHENTLTSSAIVTTSYADVGGLTIESPPTGESGHAKAVALWLTIPTGTMPGDYTYTLYVQVVQA